MTASSEQLVDQPDSSRSSILERPFVYICSLRRTGSTVVSESLTNLPHAFIFREPKFGRNRCGFKEEDVQSFRKLGVDLIALREQWIENKKTPPILTILKEEVFPRIAKQVKQIGVKEIRHEGWQGYYKEFPNMRVVLTGRDPRDIYISLHQRLKAGLGSWKGTFTPESVAENLIGQFTHQQEIACKFETFRMRYEDFCIEQECFERMRRFVASPLQGIGQIGGFLTREREQKLHGGQITSTQVGRWKQESDVQLVEQAQTCFDLMSEYAEFWQYDRRIGPIPLDDSSEQAL